MLSLVWIAVIALTGAYIVNYYLCFARNLAAAKQSGIPYVIAPVYMFNRFWLVTHRLWIPFLEKLPSKWTENWLPLMDIEWTWTQKHAPFKRLGSDIILLVSPGRTAVFVADAEAHTQICTRRNDFPKPIEMYGSVDLFGKNVVSTEGSIWRHHRKITSPPFTEKNNYQVWLESLHQGESMLTSWIKQGKESVARVPDVGADTMRLSLHVISRAGFGVRLLWPHEELEQGGKAGVIPEGHTMTYKDALSTLLENILAVMLIPRWLLIRSPLKSNQIAYNSFLEWGKYMREMYQEKRSEVQAGETREGMDLMGALISGAGITSDSISTQDPEKGSKQLLTDDEILGNAFVFILAGHETAANTLHFSMLYLAMHYGSQARLHRDLDEIFGDRPVSEWDYDRDVPKLFGSMAGAVMNEELRLIPPVVGIPKSTPKGSPQPMIIGGKRVIVPGGSHVTLDTVATHRNPKYWPTLCGPDATEADIDADLDSFKPERWLLDTKTRPGHAAAAAAAQVDHATDLEATEDIGGPNSQDTSASLFRPPRGAYIPFSEGFRACLGRRFAQVEVLAVLAVIFREYSVELALDEYASDDELAAMGAKQREQTWRKAKGRAESLLKHGMGSIITIQMRDGKVPMKFVKRGLERFKYD
ncbi:hypothetical protein MBLNU459_g1755t1 [Dothideomycetes sp. NU459]